MKKFIRVLLIIFFLILIAFSVFFAYLTGNEYKPKDVEQIDVSGAAKYEAIPAGSQLSIISWNIGYAGLGEDSNFFMDGGQDTASADRETVNKYLSGITSTLYNDNADTSIYMLQEVDINSKRTYGIDERERLTLSNGAHALNHSTPFVPTPFPDFIGKANAGLFTTSDYAINYAYRIALPCPFKWPVSTVNLKRCLLVTYMPIEGTDRQLVLVNLHLEAYDDGEGKIAQTNMLREFIQSEYEKGNYVIAAGDFNQSFPGSLEKYPIINPNLWTPGILENDLLPEGWHLEYDLKTPSCRLLNQNYDPSDTEHTQHYVIDGFIVSPGITIDGIQTLDCGFRNSDHNPVKLTFKITPEQGN